ncbi:MAG: tetratricopeptide repeat protein [Elusimicrobiota bacterium]
MRRALLYIPAGLLFFLAGRTMSERGKPEPDFGWAATSSQAIALHEQGLYAEALLPAAETLQIAEGFGENDFRIVYSLDLTGRIYRRIGRLEEAEDLHRRAVEINQKTLAADDIKHVFYLGNLADALAARGKFDEAEPLYYRVLALHRRAADEFSNPVARDWARIGTLYKNWGLYKRAGETFRRVGAITERIDAPDPMVSADRTSAMCGMLLKKGWPLVARPLARNRFLKDVDPQEDAAALCAQALSLRLARLPPDHPDLAEAHSDMGLVSLRKGDLEAAEEHLASALRIYGRNSRAEAARQAEARLNLAELRAAQGRIAEAKDMFSALLPQYEHVLGVDHYAVVRRVMDIARFHAAAGDYAAAEALYRKAAVRQAESPQADRADREYLLSRIAELYWMRGKYEEAEAYYRRAVEANEIENGLDDRSVLDTLHALARLYAQRRRSVELNLCVERMQRILERNLGIRHRANSAAYHAIMRLYRDADIAPPRRLFAKRASGLR